MSERKLNDFRRLLELQDRAEIRWKELKASGGDEDGEMEAKLRRKFTRLLEQFGLDKHGTGENNEIKDNTAGRGIYADKHLDELWESVRKQGTCLGKISAQPQTLIRLNYLCMLVRFVRVSMTVMLCIQYGAMRKSLVTPTSPRGGDDSLGVG